MENQTVDTARYHVLLIGIDEYAVRPLAGCVNDVDAVQRVVLGMNVPAERIRRLASPAPGTHHETAVTGAPATLDNIRTALTALGSEEVAEGDRVFIYYSGHGARAPITGGDGRRFHREALVPTDFSPDDPQATLLFDHELNELLRAIVARTRSVTLVLDCCHSAGATRDGDDPRDRRSRFIDLSRLAPIPDPARGERAISVGPALGSVDDCHVVSACLGHELAKEELGADGVRHGILTRAFITALGSLDPRTVSWGRIWQAMCAHVDARNPWQHPSMTGNAARVVFAGPPVDGDPGIPLRRDGDGYRLAAGTLAGITRGAELAIYGERPPYFPPVGSTADHEARIGLVVVDDADRASASVRAVAAFDLPPGARARLVKAGAAARLACAVVPSATADRATVTALEVQIADSPLLALTRPPSEPDVRLEQRDGRWILTDKVHGRGDDGPILFALQPAELDCARAVLEHYHAYAQPLRLAERASDMPGGLTLHALSCPADRELTAAEAQAASLPDAPSRGAGTYALTSGARVCFRVRNESAHRMRVTLLNAAASGKVQLLGDDVIDAGAFHVFWARSSLGMPFQMTPPAGSAWCIDRLVAIGRTAVAHDLGYLRVDGTFAQIIQRTRSAGKDMREIDDGSDRAMAPIERWTAAQAIIETKRA